MPSAGIFCEHRKLRTSCPACKGAIEAEVRAERMRIAPPTVKQVRASIAREEKREEAPQGPKPLGRPVRKRKKGVTRDEAENAEAWWVKRD